MNVENKFEFEPTNHSAMEQQLALLRQNIEVHTYPGYPDRKNRLVADPHDFATHNDRLVLPDGPWVVDTHPRQQKVEHAPSSEEQQLFISKGLRLDAAGRPLHPWFTQMLTDSSIGVVLGKGAYWHWGPNYTADSIIVCQNHVLLIKRGDTGLWALPGGHLDEGEEAASAAVREVAEETGLVIPESAKETEVYVGPVVDLRATAHAWPETTAILYRLDQELTDVSGMDDAADAAWVPISVLQHENMLFGSHRFLLDLGLKQLKSPS